MFLCIPAVELDRLVDELRYLPPSAVESFRRKQVFHFWLRRSAWWYAMAIDCFHYYYAEYRVRGVEELLISRGHYHVGTHEYD
jgi:hypothetical protein